MIEALTGTGLAASAGLNAYLPMIAVGLIGRFTDFLTVPPGWSWLENTWVLVVLAVLVVVEFVADKVPAVDTVNDVIQTVVRPGAGGITFGASASGETVTLADPGAFFAQNWVPIVVGAVIALVFHGGKATTSAVVNVGTAGFGGPVASIIEDVITVVMIAVAIFLPLLVIVVVGGMLAIFIWAFRRWRRRRRARAAARDLAPTT